MSDEKKTGSCGTGCGCCSGGKFLIGLLLGAFIFAAGMWFAKAHCHCKTQGLNYCPINEAK